MVKRDTFPLLSSDRISLTGDNPNVNVTAFVTRIVSVSECTTFTFTKKHYTIFIHERFHSMSYLYRHHVRNYALITKIIVKPILGFRD